jgi:hypothetical protein
VGLLGTFYNKAISGRIWREEETPVPGASPEDFMAHK